MWRGGTKSTIPARKTAGMGLWEVQHTSGGKEVGGGSCHDFRAIAPIRALARGDWDGNGVTKEWRAYGFKVLSGGGPSLYSLIIRGKGCCSWVRPKGKEKKKVSGGQYTLEGVAYRPNRRVSTVSAKKIIVKTTKWMEKS